MNDMIIGCFALVTPFSSLRKQFQLIRQNLLDPTSAAGFDGPTTLEVVGEENVKRSAERLRAWSHA